MRTIFGTALMVYGLYVAPASAALQNGETLHDACGSTDEKLRLFCAGYATGVVDSFDRSSAPFCLPPGASPHQIMHVVSAYLRQHPKVRQVPADAVVLDAVSQAFP